jgi:hypothetical protein
MGFMAGLFGIRQTDPVICEERSEAIHSFFSSRDGLRRFARNDEFGRSPEFG